MKVPHLVLSAQSEGPLFARHSIQILRLNITILETGARWVWRWSTCALSITLLVTGCEAPNVFRDVPTNRPHAFLTLVNPPGLRGAFGLGRYVSPQYINDQPTSFWRTRDHFRIRPGPTIVDVIDANEPCNYERVRFVAVYGRQFVLRPILIKGRDAVTVSDRLSGNGPESIVASAFRARE
jgi:hypothetical protein